MNRRAPHLVTTSALALLATLGSASCAGILGIEELPLRGEGAPATAAGDVSAEGGSVHDGDAGPGTSTACPGHDFCDAFDAPGWTTASWSGIQGTPNPLTLENAGVRVEGSGLSAPNALTAFARTAADPTHAFLMQRLDHATSRPGRPLAGARLSANVKLDALAFTEIRGPLPGVPSATLASVARHDGALSGVQILASTEGLYLHATSDVLGASPPDGGADGGVDATQIYSGSALGLFERWVRVELFVADKARAVEDGYGSCAKLPEGPVVAVGLGPDRLRQGCTALPPYFGGLPWIAEPVIALGAALYGGGELTVRYDDVTFDFLEP